MDFPIVRGNGLTAVVNPSKWPSQDEVTIPNEAWPVTVGEAMTFLRVYDQQDPTTIGDLIEACSMQVERVIQRDTYRRTRQSYWGDYLGQVWLPYGIHGDVLEVKAVTEDGVDTVLTEGVDYRVYRTNFKIIDLLQYKGRQLYVTYESGYLPGECPAAIRMAILQEVSFQYKNRQDPNLGSGISYNGLTLEAMHLLQPYKRINF
jgi:hypothetical protein